MKILNELPPIHEAILSAGLNPSATAMYTYGDTIYNPSSQFVPADIIAHEEVHERQQKALDTSEGADDGKDIWWSRFLDDQYFRMEQEAEAYAAQYDFMCKKHKDRNQRNRILLHYSRTLASPTYGSVLSGSASRNLIMSKIKTKR